MFQEREYYNFIEISKNKAKDVLSLFFSRLGYNDIFNHLFDIEIYIDYNGSVTYEGSSAVYNHDSNIIDDSLNFNEEKRLEHNNPLRYHSIWINYDYLKSLYNDYENGNNLEKKSAILVLCETIIHEIIHENRAILRKFDNTLNNLDYIYASFEKEKSINLKYDVNLFRSEVERLYLTNDLGEEVLISSCRGLENYDVYYNSNIKLFVIKSIDGSVIDQIDDAIIYGYDDETYLSSSFYNKRNISDKIYESKEIVKVRILSQRGIEEGLTEALTNMIFNSNFYDSFDLEEETNTVICDNQTRLYVKAACHIYKTFGYDFMNWFIFSCYEDEYEDILEETFGEYYDRVLEIFSHLYYCNNDRKYINEYYELLNIIKCVKKSKKLV
jgi:hypothetical protein